MMLAPRSGQLDPITERPAASASAGLLSRADLPREQREGGCVITPTNDSHVGGSTLITRAELDRLLAEGAPTRRGRQVRAKGGQFVKEAAGPPR
jgi:hypothetical protein